MTTFLLDPVDPVDLLDPAENSGRLQFAVVYYDFGTFYRKR